MKIWGVVLIIVVLVSVAALARQYANRPTGSFVDQTVTVEGEDYRYQVFVPAGWQTSRKGPLVLFLHGAGERGSDGRAHTYEGLGNYLRSSRDFPAVVVFPQCPRGAWWGTPQVEKLVFAALQDAITRYAPDPARIYLTGLSLGGYATWAFGYKFPRKFAALAPVCGGVRSRRSIPVPEWHPSADPANNPYELTAHALKEIPIWTFHGEVDRTVPVEESRRMVEALKKLGSQVRYTEYPGVGHNSWDRAYSEPGFWDWFLEQKNPHLPTP